MVSTQVVDRSDLGQLQCVVDDDPADRLAAVIWLFAQRGAEIERQRAEQHDPTPLTFPLIVRRDR